MDRHLALVALVGEIRRPAMSRWGWLPVVLLLGLLWEAILHVKRPDSVREPGRSGYNTDYLYQNLIPALPVADSFDFPLRPPDGEGSYLGRSFGENNEVGESWMLEPGRAAGREPVHACADGMVLLAENFMSDWGCVVIVVHRLPHGAEFSAVETLYGGMEDLKVVAGDMVRRGQQLGSLPSGGEGALRLELRTQAGMGLGPGAAAHAEGWVAPTPFIRAHRR